MSTQLLNQIKPVQNRTSQSEETGNGNLSRRSFFKCMGAGAAVIGLASACSRKDPNEGLEGLQGTNLVMVIDLQRCTGCGGCDLACKSENNLREGHFWSHHITNTTGTFPNVRYEYLPTLCNHCENAPCEKACPTSAIHKVAGGITAHDPDKCIGCRACIINCPYGEVHANFGKPHGEWLQQEELIAGVTGSPKSTLEEVGGLGTPYYNNERENFGTGSRYHGIVEKCDFCLHRLKEKKLPACVKRCPTDARIFGDLNNPDSSVSRLLAKYRPFRRMEHLGTQPKVYYVRSFNSASDYVQTKGELADAGLYPGEGRNAHRSERQLKSERFDNSEPVAVDNESLHEQLFG
jgi:Fe-S-cluster-containing dehydrogenase component